MNKFNSIAISILVALLIMLAYEDMFLTFKVSILESQLTVCRDGIGVTK